MRDLADAIPRRLPLHCAVRAYLSGADLVALRVRYGDDLADPAPLGMPSKKKNLAPQVRIQALIEGYAAGMSLPQLSSIHGLAACTIWKRLKAAGVTLRPAGAKARSPDGPPRRVRKKTFADIASQTRSSGEKKCATIVPFPSLQPSTA